MAFIQKYILFLAKQFGATFASSYRQLFFRKGVWKRKLLFLLLVLIRDIEKQIFHV